MQPTRLLLLALLAGCGARGALGQASISGECKPGDASCRRPMPSAPLAVGARVRPDVQVDLAGSLTPVVALASSRDDVVAVDDGALVARAPGIAAVLIGTSDGTVIDFQHVWVAQPTSVIVERRTLHGMLEEVVGPLQLVAGEPLVVTSALLGGAQRLAGDGEMSWAVEGDAGAVSLLGDGAAGRRRLIARQPGAAKVVVGSLGVTTTLDVEVVP
jgi:hypothetical protein